MIKGLSQPAHRWRNHTLTPIALSRSSSPLIGLNDEQTLLDRNIELFVSGKRALNVLLWGEKGAGKSTMVRSLASKYSPKGLRIIEFCDNDFYTIYDLYAMIRQYGGFKFIIYFDDVSFDDNDEKYRNFKSIVEGGLEEKPANALFMATSNRRHLISETIRDTSDIYSRDDQNESASLYARFGLSIGFYPLTRELYLEIAAHYLQGSTFSGWEEEAMAFAIERGGRSGRVAEQFAIYKELTWKH